MKKGVGYKSKSNRIVSQNMNHEVISGNVTELENHQSLNS
jgi:hypothetical protein